MISAMGETVLASIAKRSRITVGIQVLVVDDSSVIRQVIARIIAHTGMEVDKVFEASNGQEALEVISNQQVDLVFSDINMPRMNGLEMLTQLRRLEGKRDLPVIMISVEGTESAMEEAMELGATGYVLKPFTPETLAQNLRMLGLMPKAREHPQSEVDLSDPSSF